MRILYVEDNQANVFLVRRVAKMGDHEVMNYIDGEEALRKIDAINPDLILMDIQLSGALTGLDVVRKLRSDGYKMPIIAVTAYAMVGDMEKCLAAGCDDYLAKPLPIQRLVEIFERIERTFSTTEREAVIVKLQDETGSLTGSITARTGELSRLSTDGKPAHPVVVVPASTPKPVETAAPVAATPVETPKAEPAAAPATPVADVAVETPKIEPAAAPAPSVTATPVLTPKVELVTAPVPDTSTQAAPADDTPVSNATKEDAVTQPSVADKVADAPKDEQTEPSAPKDVAVAVVAESRADTPAPDAASGEEIIKRADK